MVTFSEGAAVLSANAEAETLRARAVREAAKKRSAFMVDYLWW
jgi:hypothetical protein